MKCLEAEIFGQVIRRLRREKGLSQEKLAELSDLDTTYISMIERGVRVPTIRTVFSLARGLGVNASELLLRVEADPCFLDTKDAKNTIVPSHSPQ